VNARWRNLPSTERSLRAMSTLQLDAVMAIETVAYEFPWTRGNFVDALAAGYSAQLLKVGDVLAGYYVLMAGVDEMHLLNLTVEPTQQGRGHAVFMLEHIVAHCRRRRAQKLWLEVRGSNGRAREVYRRFGLADIGLRKGYYPAPYGRREDAIVMGLALTEGLDALE